VTRVAVYCRVSTDKADQAHSFSSQKAFFIHYIDGRPDWSLAGLYADEGITGTTTADRTGFLRMMNDAQLGKFDMIITKEVSRFSRNILDAISYTRKLKEIGVGVIFLNDGICSVDPDAELRLGIMASVAQEESRRTSERVKWGQTRQMERGVVFGRSLLGYDVQNGRMTLEPEGANTVRGIFDMYTNKRMGVRAIAHSLTENNVPTKTGYAIWTGAAVLKIIRNEKYCGDLIQKKTVTTDYLTHKKIKNFPKDMICIRAHHEPIISREEWEAAQVERKRRSSVSAENKSGGNKYLLSGRITCAGCGMTYLCRTRKRKNGRGYRVWNCPRCSCTEKAVQIREEDLARCVRHIIAIIGRDSLNDEMGGIIEKALYAKDSCDREYEKRKSLAERKILKLTDIYLADEIGREEYHALKALYENELVKLESLRHQTAISNSLSPHIMKTIQALASGEDTDDDFYLALVDRVEIVSKVDISIYMVNSVGKWTVEFE
jgi:DNA invertase Pin-like site-specific DNA recombinase